MQMFKVIFIIAAVLIVALIIKFIISICATDSKNYPYGKNDDEPYYSNYGRNRQHRKHRKK